MGGNIRYYVLISLLLVVVSGCSTNTINSANNASSVNTQIDSKTNSTDSINTITENKPIEEKGILIDKIKFKDDKTSGEIIKNKLLKTAEIQLTMNLNDSEEYTDFMGEQMATAPFMINMACGLFTVAFFNQSALAELQDSGNMSIETTESSPLNGYTVTKSSLVFYDYETKEKIADCTATQAGWDNIKFNAYRTYNQSFFGMQIGKLPETDETENET